MAPDGTRYPGDARSPGADPSLAPSARSSLGTGRIEAADLGELLLEAGGSRLSVTLAYRHDGPGPDAPQVLIVHALTGSADAAGDWWEPLIGPGRALDTTRVGVLCANLLGGRYGSTGPTSVDPATGRALRCVLPGRLRARRGAGAVGARGPARHRAVRARHRRVAGRHDRAGVRARAAGRGRPPAADGGARRDRRDGDRLEPHPARAHRPARRRGPRARPPARDDHLPLRGGLRRPVRAGARGRRAVLDRLLPRPPGRQAPRAVRPRHVPGARPGHGRPRRRAGTAAGSSRRFGRWRRPVSASPASGSRATSSTGRTQVRRARGAGRRRRRRRGVPRDPLDQGPRRVPHRVGPARRDPRGPRSPTGSSAPCARARSTAEAVAGAA